MNLLKIDSVGGASGDMCLALCAALGADLTEISNQISDANPGDFEIVSENAQSHSISGTRVRVTVEEQHRHRHLADIIEIIHASGLDKQAQDLAEGTFRLLAEAEGKVHGIEPAKVHFHEVGALDSIVDILGACAGISMLGVEAVSVGTLPTGTGTVKCAHGVMPVPVPATAELLKHHSILSTPEEGEMITPTGAALLMHWKSALPVKHECSLELNAVGYAMGHREMDRPNTIRGMLLSDSQMEVLTDECVELQTNLDDITPEQVGWLQKRLISEGALDVSSAPLAMKKQRPGMLLTVLCKPAQTRKLEKIVFEESTSLGVRQTFKTRTVLKRELVEVETEYGTVRVKVGRLGKDIVTRSPEYEDCAKLASAKNVPFRKIYESASTRFDKFQ